MTTGHEDSPGRERTHKFPAAISQKGTSVLTYKTEERRSPVACFRSTGMTSCDEVAEVAGNNGHRCQAEERALPRGRPPVTLQLRERRTYSGRKWVALRMEGAVSGVPRAAPGTRGTLTQVVHYY